MSKLKINYSYHKEIYIIDKYKNAFEEYGEEIPDVEKPADKTKADVNELDIGWDNPDEQRIRGLIKEYYKENGVFAFQQFWLERASLGISFI